MANRVATITTKTSATGNNPGFTLIEVMVVMAIMGIMLGVALSMTSSNREVYQLRQETARLRGALQMAALDAILHGNEWGMVVGPHTYGFMRFDETTKSWLSVGDGVLASYDLPHALTLNVKTAAPVSLPVDSASPLPAIVLLSSGQTTAFELTLRAEGAAAAAQLGTDGHSDIRFSEIANDTP